MNLSALIAVCLGHQEEFVVRSAANGAQTLVTHVQRLRWRAEKEEEEEEEEEQDQEEELARAHTARDLKTFAAVDFVTPIASALARRPAPDIADRLLTTLSRLIDVCPSAAGALTKSSGKDMLAGALSHWLGYFGSSAVRRSACSVIASLAAIGEVGVAAIVDAELLPAFLPRLRYDKLDVEMEAIRGFFSLAREGSRAHQL